MKDAAEVGVLNKELVETAHYELSNDSQPNTVKLCTILTQRVMYILLTWTINYEQRYLKL